MVISRSINGYLSKQDGKRMFLDRWIVFEVSLYLVFYFLSLSIYYIIRFYSQTISSNTLFIFLCSLINIEKIVLSSAGCSSIQIIKLSILVCSSHRPRLYWQKRLHDLVSMDNRQLTHTIH
jgi:hypothetical protein